MGLFGGVTPVGGGFLDSVLQEHSEGMIFFFSHFFPTRGGLVVNCCDGDLHGLCLCFCGHDGENGKGTV